MFSIDATVLTTSSTIDADTFDSLNSTQFLRSDTSATYAGTTLSIAGTLRLNETATSAGSQSENLAWQYRDNSAISQTVNMYVDFDGISPQLYFGGNDVYHNGNKPSATDVGLSNVLNYGIATQAEAEAGTNNTTYMTPLRTAEAIAAQAGGGGQTWTPLRTSMLWDSVASGTTGGNVAVGTTLVDNAVYAIEVNDTNGTDTNGKILIIGLSDAADTTPDTTDASNGYGWTTQQSGILYWYGFSVSGSGSTLYFDNAYYTTSGLVTSEAIYTLYVRRIWRVE